jgi:peroxiredoxin (alkyl hydroperoxide reductase subunit C)
MKYFAYILTFFLSMSVFAQLNEDIRIPTLNQTAPSFVAQSTQGAIKFPEDFFGKWRIIFSHPADFTPVCTSEIWELAQIQDKFEELGTKIMIISTDGLHSHMSWIEAIEKLEYQGRKPAKVKFPIISDVNMKISKQYGMLHPYLNSTQNVRGVFIISPDNHVQYIAFYPSSVGRNMNEIIRVLHALQLTYNDKLLTPVNWVKGQDCMIAPPLNEKEAENFRAKYRDGYYSYNWFMWFMKMEK